MLSGKLWLTNSSTGQFKAALILRKKPQKTHHFESPVSKALGLEKMNYRKCLDDAVSLVEDCESNLPSLKQLYETSLEKKKVDSILLVRVKNTLENLRSSLDFCAQAIVIKYSNKKPKRIYFPYATLNTPKEKFENDNRIEKALPDLKIKRPDLFDTIIAMQHFSHEGAKWFPQFMALNNKNKHVHLVPNEITEGVVLEVDGSKIYAKSISLGKTGSISTTKGVLKGPLNITPQNVAEYADMCVAKAAYWESIFIDGYGFPMNAYEFNSHCVRAISSVVKQFSGAMP